MFSKSQYLTAKQCHKALWLIKNKPDVLDDCEPPNGVLENGRIVGEYARQLFPGGMLVEFDENADKAAAVTSHHIENGVKTIYEPAFMFKNYMAICDILHKTENGGEMYEVKSATECKPEYIYDAVFQYFVLSSLNMNISKVNIIYINNEYERNGDLNLYELFKIEDITEQVKELSDKVSEELDSILSMIEIMDEPELGIGEYCLKPNECACKPYCWSHIPEYSVFNLAGMRKSKMFQMYEQGLVTFEDIAASGVKLSSKSQEIQIRSQLYDENILNVDEINEFLKTVSIPLYFLDFETFQQPIPMFDKQKPYEQIPFQYSLHYLESEGGELKHKEYLAKEGQDPRRELAERLVKDIPKDVCTMAYNMQFEKMVISRLAQQFPDLSEHLLNIHQNMVDLMVPFQKKHYYLKEMKGSYSIKYVLPSLFPDNDELNYKRLNIRNGSMAMETFAVLHLKEPDEIAQIRHDLLEYCKLDTLAMVRVWEKLKEKCK